MHRRASLMVVTLATLLAGCSSTAEEDVAAGAARMNAAKNKVLDYARAEGRTLVVRYKPIPLGAVSDSEAAKLTTAGMCTIDGIADLLAKGGRLRLELPRRGDFIRVEVERCDGTKAVVKMADPAPVAGKAAAPSSGDWPTAAPIQN